MPSFVLRLLVVGGLLGVAASAVAGNDLRARLQYIQRCSGCHLVDGTGSPAKGIPSMRGTLGEFLAVAGGREFIVQVPGVMNSGLGDADVAALMNWLLPTVSHETLPASFAPYTAEEIARLRTSRPTDILAVRAALRAKMRDRPGL
jgi:mono/diheme cytochrome c family protein